MPPSQPIKPDQAINLLAEQRDKAQSLLVEAETLWDKPAPLPHNPVPWWKPDMGILSRPMNEIFAPMSLTPDEAKRITQWVNHVAIWNVTARNTLSMVLGQESSDIDKIIELSYQPISAFNMLGKLSAHRLVDYHSAKLNKFNTFSAGLISTLEAQIRVGHTETILLAYSTVHAAAENAEKFSIEVNSSPTFIGRNRQVTHIGDNLKAEGGGVAAKGAIVNYKTKLDNVTQTIQAAQGLPESQKSDLAQQVDTLKTNLDAIPEEKRRERAHHIKDVTDQLDSLVEQASRSPEKRNESLLTVAGEGLKAAAKALADIAPTVLETATLIVKTIVGV